MIDSNVIEYLDFGDSTQKIDIYSKKNLKNIFNFIRILLKNKSFPIIIDILLMIISFLQLLCITTLFISPDNDIILEILHYIKNIFLIFEMNVYSKIFLKLWIVFITIILVDIILMILIFFKILKNVLIIVMVNIINIIIYYYIIGPVIDISSMVFYCEDGQHKYLNIKCFSNYHIFYIIVSIFFCLLYIFVSIVYSLFCQEIGSITNNINTKIIRVNCNYELFNIIIKIIIFLFCFVLKIIYNEFIIKIIYVICIFLISVTMSIYIYKYVFYYNFFINYINYFGWLFNSWLSLCIIVKILFNINNITTIIIIGWIIIILILNKGYNISYFSLMTEANIIELKSIKLFEMFNYNLLKLLTNKNNCNSKILIYGNIKEFEEYANSNPEINYQYQKLINDKYLNYKYNVADLAILSIIYILYFIQLEKSIYKEEITIYMCYFLINKLNNLTFAIYLCQKLKSLNYKIFFYKYLLLEDIKEHLVYKLKKTNKDSVKNAQIGSIILYYVYSDLMKIKIYDALCYQIEYFDLLKNNIITSNTTKNLISIGNNNLKTRKQIINIFEKIIELNPFSDEPYKDYKLYLDTIIQDEILSENELKKYIALKNNKLKEKFNLYSNILSISTNTIILVDGYLSNGKILYMSPNFSFLFNYNGKELLNINIDELIPTAIQSYHRELIDDAIKYSNINYIFKKQKNSLLKNKNGGIININLFVKPVPNISFGLIYYIYLQKINESSLIIVLDKDFKINGFSEMSKSGQTLYNLNHTLYGYHIGLIIPDILPLLEFRNEEFNIIKEDIELKGYLYQIDKIDNIKNKVDAVLGKIKNNNKNVVNDTHKHIEDNLNNILKEFKELISELNNDNNKIFCIFYKVKKYSFLGGKYKYYRIYIYDNFIKENNNENDLIHIIKRKNEITSKRNKKIFRLINDKKSNSKNNEYNEIILNETNNKEISDKNNKKEKNENKSFYMTSKDINFNNLRLNILNKKEIYSITLIKIASILMWAISILFIISSEIQSTIYFQNLSKFCKENIYFNITKMNIATLYICSTNLKWQLNSCNLSVHFYNITSLYESLILENINYLFTIKKELIQFNKEYSEILNKRYDVELSTYGSQIKEIYQFKLDNLLTYFINIGNNIIKNYFNFLSAKLMSSIIYEYELDDFLNQTYLYYNSDIDGFKNKEKKQKIKHFNNFPIGFIINGLILLIYLILCALYLFKLFNKEVYLLNNLVSFNSINFENYINKLDEIKRKFQNNSTIEEGDKDDIDFNEDIQNNSKKEEDENDEINQNNNIINTQKTTKNTKKKKGNKQKQNEAKIKLLSLYFLKINLIFGIEIIILILICLSYYIVLMSSVKSTKKNFLSFDRINDYVIGVFKESYDNFMILKRQMQKYEDTLVNCQPGNKELYKMNIPSINNIKIPTLGDTIIQINGDSGFKDETLTNFTKLFNGNACNLIANTILSKELCTIFLKGSLTNGIEQTITKIGSTFGEIIEDLNSINKNQKTFNEILEYSSFKSFELFIEFFYQRAYIYANEIFNNLRNEKLDFILGILKTFLICYMIFSNLFFFCFLYSFYKFKDIFNSFLYFIIIIPKNYFYDDDQFFNDIIVIGKEY